MGATGYIGGRLAPRLAEAGHEVRCLDPPPRTADRGAVGRRVWRSSRATRSTRPASAAAMDGVDVVYYLVHSIGTGSDFEDAGPRRRPQHR